MSNEDPFVDHGMVVISVGMHLVSVNAILLQQIINLKNIYCGATVLVFRGYS